MVNFKQPKHSNKRPESIDGFIPNTGALDGTSKDIRKHFRQHYSPKQHADVSPQTIGDSFNQSEDFEPNSASLDEISHADSSLHTHSSKSFDFNLEARPKTKRRSLFKRKDKSGKPKKTVKKRILRAFGVTFAVFLLGVASILGYGYLKARQIFKGNGEGAAALQENVDPSRLNGEGDGRVNIMLIGKGGPGHTAPDLTDTILIASIDPLHNEAALLSVPRDLYVQTTSGGSSKINAIYSMAKQQKLAENPKATEAAEDAGLKALKQTVSDVLGIPMHYYVMVNFKGFQEAIDTVGGITVDVKDPLYDASMAWLNNWNPLIADEGLQTMNGKKALMYSRSRYGSARGDFDRTERQRQVIVALQQKVLSLGTFSNPFKVVELLNTLGNNVRTDLNGTSELKRLYEISQKIQGNKVNSIGLADPPKILVVTDNIAGQSVVVPSAGLYQYEQIQSFVRNKLRDAFLRSEDARVIILNGTSTPGLATVREKELKSYGYNVVGVDNAPTNNYTTSKLIDLSNGQKPYTASYLSKRLGISATNESIAGIPTNETADFVIILGSDEALKTSPN